MAMILRLMTEHGTKDYDASGALSILRVFEWASSPWAISLRGPEVTANGKILAVPYTLLHHFPKPIINRRFSVSPTYLHHAKLSKGGAVP